MSSSTHNQKFLIDENVRIELYRYLRNQDFDVTKVAKSTPDINIASLSKSEQRILVTNDEDFSQYSKDHIFAVVWLRIPQRDPQSLISSFEKMLKEIKREEASIIEIEKII